VNLVVTTLLTSHVDPQRGDRWPSDISLLDELLDSLAAHDVAAVVLHDRPLHTDRDGVELVAVAAGGNPYFHRWKVIADLLVSPSYRNLIGDDAVWCVDGTDVVMLRPPFSAMTPGALHIGSECSTLSDPWLAPNHPSVRELVAANPDGILYNAGVLGGDRAHVLRFAACLAACDPGQDMTDMGVINDLAHIWPELLVTGEPVHTRFKGYEHDHASAWWRHK
jgi:hypothetical protein